MPNDMSLNISPFLQGNFAPVKEEVDTELLDVKGEIPADIEGYFLRTGPNPQFLPPHPEKYHWFDGDGMIHAINVKNGKASYTNRYVHTRGYEIEKEAGEGLWDGFMSMPDFNNKHGIPMKNVANTAVIYHSGRLLALWEAGSPHSLSLPGLETQGMENFQDKWPYEFTAHPTKDPRSGEMITFGYSPIKQPYVNYGVINAAGEVIHHTGIELPTPVMIHDCAITENYTIIMDMPVTFSLERAMKGEPAFDWEPSNGARMGIIPRFGQGSEIKWFDVEVGYIFHVFNAWEEGDEVVLEACRSQKTAILAADEPDVEAEFSKPRQYRFNMKTGESSEADFDEEVYCEFSRVNEDYTGVKTRYGYAACFAMDQGGKPLFDSVVKFDREKGSKEVYRFGEGVFSGEFVFAPRSNPSAEDDGYYLGYVRDEKNESSKLLIIDAQKFAEGPVCEITMPVRVPYGFHAQWVPQAEITG